VGFEEFSEELSVSVVSSQWGKTDLGSFSLGAENVFRPRDSMTVARHEVPGCQARSAWSHQENSTFVL
jgi:hypothetical protein